jgi:hypothetical protein
VGCGAIIGAVFHCLLYIAAHGDQDFSPHLLFSSFNVLAFALTFSLLVLLSIDFFIVFSDGGRVFPDS